MKRFVFLMLIILLAGGIAYSQSDKTKKKKNSPQEKVTVNKKYDENGNMVSFDSTYVYSWSGDSTMNGIPDSINIPDFFNWKGNFSSNDSVFMGDPFSDFGFDNDDIESFFDHFSDMFPDSLRQRLYSYKNDSTFHFYGDSLGSFSFNGDGRMPDFQWHLKNDSSAVKLFSEPGEFFPNDSIWEKHRELIEKQMKEMEEFQKKFFEY